MGSPLTVSYAPSFSGLAPYFALVGGGGAPAQQWTRSGTDLTGATALTYTPVAADSAKPVAVRLMPSAGQSYIFGIYGGVVAPYTTPAVTVAKFKPAKTKLKLKAPKSLKVGSRVSMSIKVKSKGKLGGKPEGQVTVLIGQLKIQKTVKNGGALITLPNLQPGSYTIAVSYSGSDYFAKSKAKTRLSVHR